MSCYKRRRLDVAVLHMRLEAHTALQRFGALLNTLIRTSPTVTMRDAVPAFGNTVFLQPLR